MQEYIAELKKKCEILFSTLNVDIMLADQDRNILIRLLQKPCPDALMERWDTYYDDMVKVLEEPKMVAWHSVWDGLLIFLDIRIEAPNGVPVYVIVGPALAKIISDIEILNHMEMDHLPQRIVRDIKAYVHQSPFFTLRTKNAFWMIRKLLASSQNVEAGFADEIPTIDQEVPEMSKKFPITNEQIVLNYQSEQKWLAFVSMGDSVSAKKVFRQMSSNDYLIQQSPNPVRMVKNLLHTMNGMCKGAAYYGGASPTAVYYVERTLAEKIERAQSAVFIETLCYEIMDAYSDTVVESKTANYSVPVKRAVAFIHRHYSDSLSRKQIAQEIHYSEGHLSRMFYLETGKKISEYINDLRIDNACKLLSGNVYSITDVALLVGFSSYGKFSVEFKKRMSMTATQYKSDIKDSIRTTKA